MRKRLAALLVVVVTATAGLSVARTISAASAPNHGYPVIGTGCGMKNALSVNTPVARRNATMACLPASGGRLTWSRAPEESGRCATGGQVWGSLKCTGGRWKSAVTFEGDMTAALAELTSVLAAVHVWSPDGPQPPTGSKFLSTQYVKSPVDVELRDRLKTAGFDLSQAREIYSITKGTDTQCRKWADPWPADFAGTRTLRTDAVVATRCPTYEISVVWSELQAIALEAGMLYHNDKAAYLTRSVEFEKRIAGVGYLGDFSIVSKKWDDTPVAELGFYVTDSSACFVYVHNNGAPYVEESVARSACS